MKNQKKILIAFCLFGFGTVIHAQQAMPSTGSNATGNGGSVSFTVGQVSYNTYSATNGSVAQGVQQPYEISVATGIETARGITLQYVVYPNPTTDNVKLKIENYKTEDLSYQLYDINGKLIQTKKVEGGETKIPMESLVPSTYFLKISDKQTEIKTFKIIKK